MPYPYYNEVYDEPPKPVKRKHKISIQNTNDEFRQQESDGVKSWKIQKNRNTQYDDEMGSFIMKQSKKMLEDSLAKTKDILEQHY